ncbi:MAG TPA: hypothetical protein DCZ95_18825 [Verrucomicrobia bacterium]|nr:MAG: hypothetical protein A2X46_17065 [Lentisphaerae bacterium GWF2_57_35]HBA86141.1 hypothetical protein [Verrucomicrobiota bacterium]
MIKSSLTRNWLAKSLLLALLNVLIVVPASSLAEDIDREFVFASGLIEIGFPDFAEKVVQQVLRLHPEQKDRAKLIQAEILISRRKFADAEALVKEMGMNNPKAQAISLALAKGYYLTGETDKAKTIYNDFFKQYEGKMPTDSDLLRFYQDSAYQFGQMLEMAGDKEGALKAYDRILKSTKDKNAQRRIMADQAALYVKLAETSSGDQQARSLAEAKKLCDSIQWGGLDIWFGQSIITLANIELVKNNSAGAQKVIMGNLDILKEIDKYLQEQGLPLSVSPMAGARFLLGGLIQRDADAMSSKKEKRDETIQLYGKALTEYYNVFAKYGDSDWGSEAGIKAQAIKTKLEKNYGKTIKMDLGKFQSKAAATQFRMADNLFTQKKYTEAVGEYLKNLNQFPEAEISVPALNNLLQCYANLNDPLYVRMIGEYLGERFSKSSIAPLGLLSLGKFYFDKNDEPMYMYAYNTYLRCFPQNERAAAILFTLGGLRKKAGDEAGAMKYYQQIVDRYPKDQYYPKALSQMAWGAFAVSNYAGAVKGFTVYLAEAQPSPDKALAQLSLADCYRQLGQFREALKEYQTLIQWLSPANNPYGNSTADVQKNKAYLEKAWFQLGYSFARLNQPPEAVPEYRAKAIKAYDFFIANYSASPLAPKALSLKGAVQMELRDPRAAATFGELSSKYPQSDEGKNALFALVRSAIEINQLDQAKTAFDKMLSRPDTYSLDEFARVGQAFLDAGMKKEAALAFQQVVSKSADRNLLERSLFGLGSAEFALKNYDAAIKALNELMTKYPKSGLFYDAKFMLGTAYEQVDRLKEAQEVLSDVFKYADKPLLINQASFNLGLIQKKMGEKAAALASFQRVALLSDPRIQELRPLIEKSLMESIALFSELQRYQDVQDCCDQYVKTFPSGDQAEAVRKIKSEAKLKAAQTTSVPSAGTPSAPAQ